MNKTLLKGNFTTEERADSELYIKTVKYTLEIGGRTIDSLYFRKVLVVKVLWLQQHVRAGAAAGGAGLVAAVTCTCSFCVSAAVPHSSAH